ncbi:MAG: hypothetical protein ACKVOE_02480 [Rickettsiales bacterium]
MNTYTKSIPVIFAALLMAGAAQAQDSYYHVPNNGRQILVEDTTLHVQQQGEVSFVTGGIGDDERAEIEAVKGDYNFYVQSASKNGAYVEDAHVIITNKAGDVVLETEAGPILYACLPVGKYQIKAQLGDQVLNQKFVITAKKPAHVHLGWNVHATVTGDEGSNAAQAR